MFQHGSACYSTAKQAAEAQASHLVGSIIQIGQEPYAVDVSAVTDSTISLTLQQLTGPGVFTKTILVTPQPCGLLQVEDAISIGWLIAAIWIGVFSLTFIARIIRSGIEERSDYGNS